MSKILIVIHIKSLCILIKKYMHCKYKFKEHYLKQHNTRYKSGNNCHITINLELNGSK